jgi:glucosamine--fructose-6-phosphate aminotransferase (isomerizing)
MASQQDELPRVVEHVRGQLPRIAALLAARRPVFVGIGASYHVAAIPTYLLQQRGIPATRVTPGQLAPGVPPLGDAAIGISQSGRSVETVELLQGWTDVPSGAVVNVAGSPLLRHVDHGIDLGSVPDSYASTVGFTATLVALGMLTESWGGGHPDSAWDELGDVVCRYEQAARGQVAGLVTALSKATSIDVVGSGISVGIAEAGALLIREVANVPAYAADTRSYLHGPMESAGQTAHLLLGGEREATAAKALAGKGHSAVVVTAEPATWASDAAAAGVEVVFTGAGPQAQVAILQTMFLQQLSRQLAESRGLDVDVFTFHAEDTKLDEQSATS